MSKYTEEFVENLKNGNESEAKQSLIKALRERIAERVNSVINKD